MSIYSMAHTDILIFFILLRTVMKEAFPEIHYFKNCKWEITQYLFIFFGEISDTG